MCIFISAEKPLLSCHLLVLSKNGSVNIVLFAEANWYDGRFKSGRIHL